jgi:RNA polymerase sigma-70 factor (sigma-E family)
MLRTWRGRAMAELGPPGFAEFMRARYSRLARSAFLLTGDRGHAEDLVQTALMATLSAWDRLSAVEAAEAYTRTTLVRLAQRASRRRWRREVPTLWEQLRTESNEVVDVSGDADLALDVGILLASLPWDQRAVLVLRFIDDLTERQTAAALKCSEGTVKSRTSRALAKLRASGLIQTEVRNG